MEIPRLVSYFLRQPNPTSQRAFKAGTLQHPQVGIDNVQKQGRVFRGGFKGGMSRVFGDAGCGW